MRLRTWLDGVLNRLSAWWQPTRRRFRKGYLSAPAPQQLEPRLLLTIDNLASISGVVYDDLTDNGLTGDDVRQQNVQVELFQDGGNGTFDSGGGDDVSLGTQTTSASGEYLFERLNAGRYFVQQSAAAGLIQRSGDDVVTVDISSSDVEGVVGTIIDEFDDPDPPPDPPQGVSASSSGSLIGSSSVSTMEVIGGERDLTVELTSATGGVSLNVNAFNLELLEFNSSTTGGGRGAIVWDGPDGDALTLDPTGLGGIDLTDGGVSEGFLLTAGVDQNGVTVTVRAYTDATSFSEGTWAVTNTGGMSIDSLFIDFAGFSQGGTATAPADFATVGAIELLIDGVVAADGQFSLFSTLGPTVATANFANFQPLSLGNLVWDDVNNNGVFDSASESGIPNVTVELFADTDGNGAFTAGTDTFLTSTDTDGSGGYLFSNLFPGDYVLRIPQSEFEPGGDLEELSASSTGNDPAPDPDTDINNDDNGTLLAGQGAVTQAVTLLANLEPDNDGDTDTNSNLAVDFGFFQPVDLQITKADSADPVNADAAFSYTLTVTNNGPEEATGVVATDVLPAGITYVSSSVTQGSVSESGGTITASIGTLAIGVSATVTINVTADASTSGTVINNASVTGDQFDVNASNNMTNEPTTVTPVVDLAITKSDNPDPVDSGATLAYTILVTNNGPSTATSVVMTDTLPAGVSFTSASTTNGTVGAAGNIVTANLGTLASGASATITINVRVDDSTLGSILNTAVVTANETELNLANNSASEPTLVNPLVDVSVVKSDDVDPVNAGSQLTYTLIVSNSGPSTATGVTLTDVLPAGVSFSSGSSTQGSVSESMGTITATLGTLASGDSETVTIVVDVAGTTTGTILNTASVTTNEPDSNLANNSANEPTTVVPVIDLAITKSDSPDPVNAGGILTYTVLVTNNGPSPATNVVMTDVLPAGVTFSSATSTQGSVSEASGTVTASLGTLASGESETITIIVDVAGTTVGTITNTATVAGTENESNLANNSATEPTTVVPIIDLAVTKSDTPDPVNAGGILTYTVLVTNNGPSPATNVVLTDALPTEVSFDSATPSQGSVSESGGTVTANLGSLASGASATVTIVATVADSALGTITNTASVAATETETNTANNVDTEPTTVTPVIDLSITKSDDVDPVDAGGTLVYTLTIANAGPSTATGVMVTDVLPSDVAFTSVTSSQGSSTESGGTISTDLGTLASGASATVTITVSVAGTAVGTFTNNASVTGNETDIAPANNSTSEDTTVRPVVDVRIDKTDSADPVNAGGSFSYTLTIVNDGPSTATNVVVTDNLPAGVTFASGASSQGTVSETSGTVTANLGTLASGASATITLNVDVADSTTGTLTNTATVTSMEHDDDPSNNSDTEPTMVTPVVDLVVTKSDSADPVNAGGSYSYTLLVTNNGPSTATGVVVTDLLPPEVSFTSGSASQGSVSESAGTVTALLGTLASGASATITLNVTTADSARGTITNTATVAGNETETNSANNQDTEPTTIVPVVDLAIAKVDSVDPAEAGGALTYTLTVTNNGPSTATGVQVTDLLPPEVSFVSAVASQGSASHSGGSVSANLGTLLSGDTATVTLNVTIADSALGVITNTASVTATETETDTTNNSATEPTTVTPVVDVQVTKVDDVDPVNAGGTVTYTLLVSNDGPSTATGVIVTDTLPSGVTFRSSSSTQGSVTSANGVVTASLGTLASGAQATILLTVDIDGSTTGTITNSVTVTTNEPDPNPDNNTDEEETTVDPVVDLAITKTDNVDSAMPGESFVYTLLVTNNGPSSATGVVVSDLLPADISFVSGTTSQGSVTESNGTVTASLGSLPNGASATVTLTVTVGSGASDTLTNTASVTATEDETDTSNNSDLESTPITQPALSTLAGVVYLDANGNGQFDNGDVGLSGVPVSLIPIDVSGSVQGAAITQATDATGAYRFEDLPAGRYRVVETQPEGFTQGSETIGTAGGNNPVPNVIDTVNLGTDVDATNYNFGEAMSSKRRFLASAGSTPTMNGATTQSALSGRVYSDANSNAMFDAGDSALAGVTVSLVPIDNSGQQIGTALIAVTDSFGVYRFAEVVPGRYRLVETQPSTHAQGVDLAGSAGGTNSGLSDDTIDAVVLASGMIATGYDFAEGAML